MADVNIRYASALFDLALEENTLDEMLEQAAFLLGALAENECESILKHPKIHSSEKRDFLEKAFGESILPSLMGLLTLAVEKSRENAILPSLAAFVEMGKKYHGMAAAKVVSATALSKEQTDSIADVLSRKLDKQVQVFAETDPSLIGGMIIQIEGYTIDHTVKKQLNEMKVSMRGGSFL